MLPLAKGCLDVRTARRFGDRGASNVGGRSSRGGTGRRLHYDGRVVEFQVAVEAYGEEELKGRG